MSDGHNDNQIISTVHLIVPPSIATCVPVVCMHAAVIWQFKCMAIWKCVYTKSQKYYENQQTGYQGPIASES